MIARRTFFWMVLMGLSSGLAGCGPAGTGSGTGGASVVGSQLPTLQPLAWLNSQEALSPASLRGRVVVVEAFASWCGPCRAMAPAMVQLHQELAAEPPTDQPAVVFVSLTPELPAEMDAVRQFVADQGIRWPVGVGAQQTLVELQVESIPATFVVDPQGRIVWRHDGWGGSGDLVPLRSAIRQTQQNHHATTNVP